MYILGERHPPVYMIKRGVHYVPLLFWRWRQPGDRINVFGIAAYFLQAQSRGHACKEEPQFMQVWLADVLPGVATPSQQYHRPEFHR